MHQPSIIRSSAAAAAAALLAAGFAPAAAQPQKNDVAVAVFSDRYVTAGRAFDDLNALESVVAAARPATVRLDACGPGVARALLAAGHRFRRLPLQLRVLPDDDPACHRNAPVAVRASMRIDQRPYNIDDAAVAHYWHGMLP